MNSANKSKRKQTMDLEEYDSETAWTDIAWVIRWLAYEIAKFLFVLCLFAAFAAAAWQLGKIL